ncbi:hypothetical protein DSM07_09840 [Oenococcus sp. UCMA 16435]|nr:hypothetical protein DSM07_09840 [Oenococcus sp. UCMA 16435]MDI4584868.1 hypothetical protein [Oenococcus sp. UCMA 14587]
MPWNYKNYPTSFKNLNVKARHKAIEIANALKRDHYENSRAIPIAIERAEKWYQDHKDSRNE